MKRNYIGLSCTGHDNAIAIVNSKGEIVFAEASERYFQFKRSLWLSPEISFEINNIIENYCEPGADLVLAKTWSDVAIRDIEKRISNIEVKINEVQADAKSNSSVELYEKNVNHGRIQLMRNVSKTIRYTGDTITTNYGFPVLGKVGRNVTTKSYDHHLTHAMTSYHTSGMKEAVCAIIDGFGEDSSYKFYHFKEGGKVEKISGPPTPRSVQVSLGFFYMAVCQACGFDPMAGDEWKVMGLAPYGKKNDEIYKVMSEMVRVEGLDLVRPENATAATFELITKYGRKKGSPPIEAKDLAYTGQLFYCDRAEQLLNNLYKLNLSENLIVGGGCSLNSSWNGKILDQTKFKALFCPSAPADDGNAIGAAVLAFYEDNPKASHPNKIHSPYLGSIIEDEDLDRAMLYCGYKTKKYSDSEVAQAGAKLLAAGKIIGWIQGRAEFGPRALGNRSILADPRSEEMKEKINAKVKFREEFRPFAPSILHEYGDEYFEHYQESPYMERTLRFKESARKKVPAVFHLDGTGRLQTVKKEWNERYFNLISEFKAITGIPLILNTSYNVMGKPISHSIEDVMAVFATSGLDALVVGNYVVEKP